MNDFESTLIELERERYKFLQELEEFHKMLSILELWNSEAKTNPQAREKLERFDELYGPDFEADFADIADKIHQAESCYRKFNRMSAHPPAHARQVARNKEENREDSRSSKKNKRKPNLF
ncbi:hypothetical protein L8P27_05130 [Enterobacter asburiae]|uniref:hypothetical protein n=1 Tax=Enterobacter asburiae TaxID=61645 RepID=UPI002006717A|nr:hypothetical protein [Enterobacter asburiae]MCK7227235.1 hypothetical protein [Enterobacter asburiae]